MMKNTLVVVVGIFLTVTSVALYFHQPAAISSVVGTGPANTRLNRSAVERGRITSRMWSVGLAGAFMALGGNISDVINSISSAI